MNPAAADLRLLLGRPVRRVSLHWRAGAADPREHRWTFADGFTMLATPAAEPDILPSGITSEEWWLARVASCHLIAWLRLAALIGAEPLDYRDDAVGMLFRPAPDAPWSGAITLDPRVDFTRPPVTLGAARRLHEIAHARHFDPREIRLRVAIRGVIELPMIELPTPPRRSTVAQAA